MLGSDTNFALVFTGTTSLEEATQLSLGTGLLTSQSEDYHPLAILNALFGMTDVMIVVVVEELLSLAMVDLLEIIQGNNLFKRLL